MNYIILNGHDFFNDQICIDGFNEVDVNGEDRVDAVFGEFSVGLLEDSFKGRDGGVKVFREQWLLCDRGVSFVCFKIPQDLLYHENSGLIEELFGFFSKKDFHLEVWSANRKAFRIDDKDTWDYYLIGVNKFLELPLAMDDIIGLTKDDKPDKEYNGSFDFLLNKIKEKIL